MKEANILSGLKCQIFSLKIQGVPHGTKKSLFQHYNCTWADIINTINHQNINIVAAFSYDI